MASVWGRQFKPILLEKGDVPMAVLLSLALDDRLGGDE